MQVVLLRVGIDTGFGGIHSPVFKDLSFELLSIPDSFALDKRTYGNTAIKKGGFLVDYFPVTRRDKMRAQSIHVDPEFETFTYGDPTPPKASLRKLQQGDILVFYAGLQGWNFSSLPALYIVGWFEIAWAGKANSISQAQLSIMFPNNFHVMHAEVFRQQRDRLVLVKGSENSRLLKTAVKISALGTDKNGRALHRFSAEMQSVFGGFAGKTSIQRSPPRWVAPEFTARAAEFIRTLR